MLCGCYCCVTLAFSRYLVPLKCLVYRMFICGSVFSYVPSLENDKFMYQALLKDDATDEEGYFEDTILIHLPQYVVVF